MLGCRPDCPCPCPCPSPPRLPAVQPWCMRRQRRWRRCSGRAWRRLRRRRVARATPTSPPRTLQRPRRRPARAATGGPSALPRPHPQRRRRHGRRRNEAGARVPPRPPSYAAFISCSPRLLGAPEGSLPSGGGGGTLPPSRQRAPRVWGAPSGSRRIGPRLPVPPCLLTSVFAGSLGPPCYPCSVTLSRRAPAAWRRRRPPPAAVRARQRAAGVAHHTPQRTHWHCPSDPAGRPTDCNAVAHSSGAGGGGCGGNLRWQQALAQQGQVHHVCVPFVCRSSTAAPPSCAALHFCHCTGSFCALALKAFRVA